MDNMNKKLINYKFWIQILCTWLLDCSWQSLCL